MIKPRTIFIRAHEDIEEIVKKIKASKTDSVILIIPRSAIIFHSKVAVKILLHEVEKIEKEITIITKDQKGREFADEFNIKNASDIEYLEKPLIKRIENKNKTEEESKIELAENNLRREKIRKITTQVRLKKEERDKQNRAENKKIYTAHFNFKPKKRIIFIVLSISLVLLFFIVNITLPGATIYIHPQEKIVQASLNVILTLDENTTADHWGKNVLPASSIETIIEKNIDFNTNTKTFTGANASGRIKIKNNLLEEVTLRPDTQLVTRNQISMRTKDWVTVPAESFEVVDVEVEAKDLMGDFVGARGNIEKEQNLTIIKLDAAMQNSIYGVIFEPLTGGVSGEVYNVSENDFVLAQKYIEEKIVEEGMLDAEKFVERKNSLEKRDLVLIPYTEFLHTEIINIEFPEDLIGANIEKFEVKVKMKVQMIAYSQAEMMSLLRTALLKNVDPGMEFIAPDPKSFASELVDKSLRNQEIKISVSIKGMQAFIIEAKGAEGIRFVNEVKENVLGKNIEEAKEFVENMPQVENVKISVWPPFSKKIPKLSENIAIELLE